jgi:glutamate-1-semialdehyde aminotransferase
VTGKINQFSESERLYKRALEVIPTASQTFSKSAMNYVRGASPLFADRGEGARLWDVDGNVYLDYVLGLLPVILGYRDPDVDNAIARQLERGITLSLATELEIELAERLVRLIPCAEMVRFGKNGTDGTSAAVRIARAATGRDMVIVCGYHGWQDWYIGSTTRHLGVPDAVRELTLTFPYNDADALEYLLKQNRDKVATIVMEPMALTQPEPGFLEAVRDLATRHDVVLVFDEIITGFRIGMGGAQSEFGVTPDIGVFGKAMANGMPISAITGRCDLMRYFEDIFISGTFGGEALSLAAAITTVDKLEAHDIPSQLRRTGGLLMGRMVEALAAAGLGNTFKRVGGDWWPGIVPDEDGNHDPILLTSLLRQEMIANGLLMGATVNLCLAHTDSGIIDETVSAFEKASLSVTEALNEPDPWVHLRGEPITPVFAVRSTNQPKER